MRHSPTDTIMAVNRNDCISGYPSEAICGQEAGAPSTASLSTIVMIPGDSVEQLLLSA